MTGRDSIILSTLSRRAYVSVREILDRLNGRFHGASIYASISRLEREDLVEKSYKRETDGDRRSRLHCRLTARGEELVRAATPFHRSSFAKSPAAGSEPFFLCHSSGDKSFVRRLAGDLKSFEVTVWLDEWELRPGDSLHGSIGKALERARYVGLILSPKAIQSRWVQKEINQALSRESRTGENIVVPILYRSVKIPPFLEDKVYLDMRADYMCSLGRLVSLAHNLDYRMTAKVLEKKPPKTLEDLKESLRSVGWQRTTVNDSEFFGQLLAFVESAGYFERSGRVHRTPDRFDIFPRFREDDDDWPSGGGGPVAC